MNTQTMVIPGFHTLQRTPREGWPKHEAGYTDTTLVRAGFLPQRIQACFAASLCQLC